ncbi:MAG TPA: hypothetical protein VGL57_14045 [Solirubrobacteraceae bacterium]|jgi:hypothetical protein
MPSPIPLEMTLLPGARALLAAHARELPQRDDLCGAFCGALALRAAGIEEYAGEPLDQDAVARAADSVVSVPGAGASLPFGERGRRDYRLTPPLVQDASASGTTAGGLLAGLTALSGERLVAIPFSGPWTARTLGGLFELAAAREHPVSLVANLATRHLWGGRPRIDQVLAYLLEGAQGGPAADWDVGHFACVVGRLWGPGGSIYAVADTYPALGNGGVHLQPQERLAAAIERRDMPAGGVIVLVFAEDAHVLRAGAAALGLSEGLWDNGTVTAGVSR